MKEVLRLVTKSEQETRKVGQFFAEEVRREKSGRAILVGLEGELGAGKTVFAKGFARGLGIKEEMKSPTFTLMRVFEIPRTKKPAWPSGRHFFLFDAYRLSGPKEFLALGFQNLLQNWANIILVEWSDRVSKIFPKRYFLIRMRHLRKNAREIGFYA